MKKEHIKLLCCPYCKGDLILKVEKEDEKEIIAGLLKCKKCGKEYEIKNGIPIMI